MPSFRTRRTLGWGEGPHLLPELDDRRRGVLRGHVQGAIGPLELYTGFYPWVPGKEAKNRSLNIWHDYRERCEILGEWGKAKYLEETRLKLFIQNTLKHRVNAATLLQLLPQDWTCGPLNVWVHILTKA